MDHDALFKMLLIHLEHQAQQDTHLPRRMLEYVTLDWIEYDLPVSPRWPSTFQTRRSFTQGLQRGSAAGPTPR
jgi:hypothetical protein